MFLRRRLRILDISIMKATAVSGSCSSNCLNAPSLILRTEQSSRTETWADRGMRSKNDSSPKMLPGSKTARVNGPLALIHRRRACRRPAEETEGCASESGIMVLKQKTGPGRKGAPDRCYHVHPDRIQIAFDDHRLVARCRADPSRHPRPCALACPNSSGSTSTSAARRAGRTPATR